MPKHQFGIMRQNPKAGKRYDQYEPERYGCLAVEDEIIEIFSEKIGSLDMFWHTVDKPAKGLAYCGVTLIPPESAQSMIAVADGKPELSELCELLRQAQSQNKFIIHFGI
ncbi:MAG: hypothetical protein PUF31_07185 [Oscillospiraceae bacterium]|nr:hypothetical protein [Oscillospiraceae bacterium]